MNLVYNCWSDLKFWIQLFKCEKDLTQCIGSTDSRLFCRNRHVGSHMWPTHVTLHSPGREGLKLQADHQPALCSSRPGVYMYVYVCACVHVCVCVHVHRKSRQLQIWILPNPSMNYKNSHGIRTLIFLKKNKQIKVTFVLILKYHDQQWVTDWSGAGFGKEGSSVLWEITVLALESFNCPR